MSKFSDEEKRDCAKRESGFRRRVYPRMVAIGRMSQEKATREIELMNEISDDYRSKTELPL